MRTPTVIGSPTCSSTSRRSRAAISVRRARDPPEPADVEERLVDREPLDQRRRLPEDLEHRLARLGVGREARRHDDGARAQPARLRTAHRGAHPVRLGLVARREHDPAADDHRAPAQLRGVALLDRGEERIEVGVQDRGLSGHEHMFASGSSGRLRYTWFSHALSAARKVPEVLLGVASRSMPATPSNTAAENPSIALSSARRSARASPRSRAPPRRRRRSARRSARPGRPFPRARRAGRSARRRRAARGPRRG